MSEIDGIYQHNFVPSSNPKEKLLCFICNTISIGSVAKTIKDIYQNSKISNNW